ncbi:MULTISPECIES: hypothetical protein [unclassified Streptomyces]|uniref:hypothetical protein n=1 Tax=unclassified Streptomyces TaxID=2593676 RepID=UPI00382A8CDC|nr:hypothetical protein OG282_13295 [Streptomyces sp. NBC_01014]
MASLQREHHAPEIKETDPIPLLPLAQLFASEVPGLTGPEDCDLLQVLWCPFDAHGLPRIPDIHLRWRKASDCGEILTTPPSPPVVGDYEYVPEPCTLHPERVVEHEYMELLSESLQERITDWEVEQEDTNDDDALTYHHDLSIAPGWKVGGYASWNVTGVNTFTCSCGIPMQLLLKIDSKEWDGGTRSWVPTEDRELIRTRDASVPTQVTVGRAGSLNIFACPVDPTHPHRVSLQ